MRNAARMTDTEQSDHSIDPAKLAAARAAAEQAVRDALGEDADSQTVVAVTGRTLVLSLGADGEVQFMSQLSMIDSANALIQAASAILSGDLVPANIADAKDRNREIVIQTGLEAGLSREQVLEMMERLENEPGDLTLDGFERIFEEMFPDVVARQNAEDAAKAKQN